MTLLSIEDCWKGFNDRQLLRGVSLSIGDGERVGLLGLNGSGKSTLLKILAGLEAPEEGKRVVRRGVQLGYLEQDPILAPERTVREIVREGFADRGRVLAELDELHTELTGASEVALTALLARQARLEERLEGLGGHDVEHRVESTLSSLGIETFDVPCGPLSGGERRRVALARLLLSGPDLLLLDEPTNHLDAFVTDWLEDWFLETRTPLLLVTHDRYFLDRVVDRIVELDRGDLVSYDGGYTEYLSARAARLETERKSEASRLNLLRRETAWMRRGPPARSTKAKARIHRYEDLVDAVPTELAADLELQIPPGPRLGSRVVQLTGIAKSFDGKAVVPPLDLQLEAGTRLGIVGPNGAGKTTLLRMILGELEADKGEREIGETVTFMGIDQMRSELDPAATVMETVAGRSGVVRTGDRTVRVEGFLDKFGFPQTAHQSKVAQLSGGEKNRLLLARLLCAGGNVLVLDEPTNDLDLATLRALEEALLVFPGSVVVVSHDRWFLDRVATRILHLDGKGGARLFHGDLSSLLAKLADEERDERKEKRASEPKKPPKKRAESDAPKKRGIAPWEQREIDELETKIAALESQISEVDEEIADPALYAGPEEKRKEVLARRCSLDEKLSGLFARWEELESKR